MAKSIEDCIGETEAEGWIEADERADLLAELTELRRAQWNWDEARAILASWGTSAYQMRAAGRQLLILVAGDGDAEWATKPHQATAPEGASR